MNFLRRFELAHPTPVVDVNDKSALKEALEKICPRNRTGMEEIVNGYKVLGGDYNLRLAGETLHSAVVTCRVAHG